MENNKVQFTTSQMLKWMEYVADLKEVSPEKIKMLNTCGNFGNNRYTQNDFNFCR